MGIEKYISGRKKVVAAASLIALIGCEAIINIPKYPFQLGDQMIRGVLTMPIQPFYLLGNNPPLNRCAENLLEKTCKLYFEEPIEGGDGLKEQYFAYVQIKKQTFSPDKRKVVFGWYDGENENMDGKKVLTVMVFEGDVDKKLEFPSFGNIELDLNDFEYYFKKPRTRTFDMSNNQIKNVVKAKLLKNYQIKKFIERLEERFGIGLEIGKRRKLF